MTMTPSAITPVAQGERHAVLDALRGFALLGILIANFEGSVGTQLPWLDGVTNGFKNIFVHASFYPLFCFLFGLGFALQLLRARNNGSGVVLLYVRRMLALMLIGTVHAVLIWNGDIVLDYALMGFLLIPLSRLKDRWLVPLVIALYAANIWAGSFRPWFTTFGRAQQSVEITELETLARSTNFPPPAAYRERVAHSDEGRIEAYQATIAANWQQYASTIRNRLSRHVLWSELFLVFIIGFIVGRRPWVQEAARYKRGVMIAAAFGATLAIGGNVGEYFLQPENRALSGLQFFAANHGTTMLYVALFALAFGSWPSTARRLRMFVPVGQMGLTGYLMQSIVMTLLFESYGIGLPAPPSTWYLLLNVVFFFAVQVTVARWWLDRFRFGPAEWAWRSMTYGELQPMRRTSPPVSLPPDAVTPVRFTGVGTPASTP